MNLLTNDFLSRVFFNWPESPKPPIAERAIIVDHEVGDDLSWSNINGWDIQLALAGYKEDDIKVWHVDNTLHITGDNTERDIIDKFKGKFHREFIISKQLALDKSVVKLEDGILYIKIPRNTEHSSVNRLFGKD